jgi:nucleoside-diphosphate-sugar epimerase
MPCRGGEPTPGGRSSSSSRAARGCASSRPSWIRGPFGRWSAPSTRSNGAAMRSRRGLPRLRRARPHSARDEQAPAAPRSAAAEWVRADLADGRGLRKALEGCDIVVHLASLPYRGPRTRAVDVRGTARLAAAAGDAGVAHLIYTSIVGVDAIPWRYFRWKLEAESVVRAAPLRWSILRATQFYPLIDAVLRASARLPLMVEPGAAPGMPVDPLDVAELPVRAIEQGPTARIDEFAGPEVLSFAELAEYGLRPAGCRREGPPSRADPGTAWAGTPRRRGATARRRTRFQNLEDKARAPLRAASPDGGRTRVRLRPTTASDLDYVLGSRHIRTLRRSSSAGPGNDISSPWPPRTLRTS